MRTRPDSVRAIYEELDSDEREAAAFGMPPRWVAEELNEAEVRLLAELSKDESQIDYQI